MPDTMNLNVRISGSMKDYVAREMNSGSYENASEYVRSLIRRDKELADQRAFEKLRNELQLAFSAPESEYIELTAEDIFARHANRKS